LFAGNEPEAADNESRSEINQESRLLAENQHRGDGGKKRLRPA
jgi:hypothetical protein